jgi:hypothetical protein
VPRNPRLVGGDESVQSKNKKSNFRDAPRCLPAYMERLSTQGAREASQGCYFTSIIMDNPVIQRPLIPILLSYLSGIFTGSYCTITPFILFVAILLLLIFLISTLIFKKNRVSLITTILLIHVLGMLAMRNILTEQLSSTHIVNYVTGEKVVLEGVIYRNPEIKLDKTRLYLTMETIAQRNKVSQITGKMLLTIKQKSTSFSSGDRIRFFATTEKRWIQVKTEETFSGFPSVIFEPVPLSDPHRYR